MSDGIEIKEIYVGGSHEGAYQDGNGNVYFHQEQMHGSVEAYVPAAIEGENTHFRLYRHVSLTHDQAIARLIEMAIESKQS